MSSHNIRLAFRLFYSLSNFMSNIQTTCMDITQNSNSPVPSIEAHHNLPLDTNIKNNYDTHLQIWRAAFATPCIRGIDFVHLRPTLLYEFHERLLVQSLVQDIRCAPPRRAINGSPDYEPVPSPHPDLVKSFTK